MLCSPDKLLEAGPSGLFKALVCALVDHPPDVSRIIEEEPFECLVLMFTEAYGVSHPLWSFVIWDLQKNVQSYTTKPALLRIRSVPLGPNEFCYT